MQKIFENITFLEQKKLLKLLEMKIKNYQNNDTVLEFINESITAIIIEGVAEISKIDYHGNKIIIEELFENSIITNMFLNKNDDLKITCKEDTMILFLDYDYVLAFENPNLKYYNQFLKNILNITNTLIKNKNERIEVLTKKSIRDKLLEYLKIESKKRGSKIIYLPFSYTDLADFLSVDRCAMSREFSNLKKEGFITVKGRKITLNNY